MWSVASNTSTQKPNMERFSCTEFEEDWKVMFVPLFKRWARVQLPRKWALCCLRRDPVWSIYKFILAHIWIYHLCPFWSIYKYINLAHCSQPHIFLEKYQTRENETKPKAQSDQCILFIFFAIFSTTCPIAVCLKLFFMEILSISNHPFSPEHCLRKPLR